jgi:hypothetical protein
MSNDTRIAQLGQESLNLGKEWGKYWKVFDDKYMFVNKQFHPVKEKVENLCATQKITKSMKARNKMLGKKS